jgi:hypothetical protein
MNPGDSMVSAFASLVSSVFALLPTVNVSAQVSTLNGVLSTVSPMVSAAAYFFPVGLACKLLVLGWGLRMASIVWAYMRFGLRIGLVRV